MTQLLEDAVNSHHRDIVNTTTTQIPTITSFAESDSMNLAIGAQLVLDQIARLGELLQLGPQGEEPQEFSEAFWIAMRLRDDARTMHEKVLADLER